jgi:hypothetical protein
MAEEIAVPAAPSSKAKAFRAVAKGLTKIAVWAVTHPEIVIQIVRQVRAEEKAKQTKASIEP